MQIYVRFLSTLFFPLWLCLFALTWSGNSHGQAAAPVWSKEDFAREIRSHFKNDAEIDAHLQTIYSGTLSTQRLKAARKNLKSIFFDERFHARLAQAAFPTKEITDRDSFGVLLWFEASKIYEAGLVIQPLEAQEELVKHLVNYSQWLPATLCKKLITAELSPKEMITLEARYTATFPVKQFEKSLARQLRAFQAGLEPEPKVKEISAENVARIKRISDPIFHQRLRERFSQETIAKLGNGLKYASPKEVCGFYQEMLLTVLDLPQPYRSWEIQRMFTLQNSSSI